MELQRRLSTTSVIRTDGGVGALIPRLNNFRWQIGEGTAGAANGSLRGVSLNAQVHFPRLKTFCVENKKPLLLCRGWIIALLMSHRGERGRDPL